MAEKPRDVAGWAWSWFRDAEGHYRRSDDNSDEELQAIQAMSASAMCALYAEHLDGKHRK